MAGSKGRCVYGVARSFHTIYTFALCVGEVPFLISTSTCDVCVFPWLCQWSEVLKFGHHVKFCLSLPFSCPG